MGALVTEEWPVGYLKETPGTALEHLFGNESVRSFVWVKFHRSSGNTGNFMNLTSQRSFLRSDMQEGGAGAEQLYVRKPSKAQPSQVAPSLGTASYSSGASLELSFIDPQEVRVRV